MTKPPAVFEHLGPHARSELTAACCRLNERVWTQYLNLAGEYKHSGNSSREYLILRMMYIAELTSSAVRLDASWGLTHPAMSLLRDRYEQAVRFSWLVRNPDEREFQKYERAIFLKMGSLARSVSVETRQHFADKLGPLPAWAMEMPTKEQRAYLDQWSALDLRSMAKKRDEFPSIAKTALANEKLAGWYDRIYAQFSSVSHYDRFSVELMTLNEKFEL